MGDAAGEFDDFQAALDVALRVGQHLAMFGGEQQGQFVHILFDQFLEAEHDAGAALGVGRGPFGLGGKGGVDRLLKMGGGGEFQLGLDRAGGGVEDVGQAGAGLGGGLSMYEMVN